MRAVRSAVNSIPGKAVSLFAAVVMATMILAPSALSAGGPTVDAGFCPGCGRENPGEAKFCGVCGEKLASAPPGVEEAPPAGVKETGMGDEALFKSGLELMNRREYDLAVVCFLQLGDLYPESEYASHAASLKVICGKLAEESEDPANKPGDHSGAKSFFGGVLGGIVGIIAIIAFLVSTA